VNNNDNKTQAQIAKLAESEREYAMGMIRMMDEYAGAFALSSNLTIAQVSLLSDSLHYSAQLAASRDFDSERILAYEMAKDNDPADVAILRQWAKESGWGAIYHDMTIISQDQADIADSE
jgi:hypothetical protein